MDGVRDHAHAFGVLPFDLIASIWNTDLLLSLSRKKLNFESSRCGYQEPWFLVFTLTLHALAHVENGRPTLKDAKQFRNGPVRFSLSEIIVNLGVNL